MSAPSYSAGFDKFTFPDMSKGNQVKCAIWYPTLAAEAEFAEGPWKFHVAFGPASEGNQHPLVVISHGTASSWREHHDTAEFLARRGFVVVALSHPGDSYDYEQKDFGGLASAVHRPRDVSRLLDGLLESPRYAPLIDANRIGVFGFSIGGYTAFVLAGGRPDFQKIATHPSDDPPSIYFGGSEEDRLEEAQSLLRATRPSADPRVHAIFVMAPALGFLFDAASLKNVRVPVRLYRAEHDQILHHPYDGETYRRMLPVAPETVVVAGAGHYVFLAPPPAMLATTLPDVFRDEGTFDRRAFHERLNAEAEAFFKATLSE
jgi:predicted dienelactone hydrolase